MLFQTELLIRSVKKYSSHRHSFFSVVVNGSMQSPIVAPNLSPGHVNNEYINRNADIWYSPYYWSIPIPHRWYIEPKSETCVLIDADIIACRDISPIYQIDLSIFHGVLAYTNPLSASDWGSLGIDGLYSVNQYKKRNGMVHYENRYEDGMPLSYFNMGMLVVPSRYLRAIGERMLVITSHIINKYPELYYFAGQIAVAKALYDLQIPTNQLPNIFNWYDILDPIGLDKIIFLHYFSNRKHITNWAINCTNNEYCDLIKRVTANLPSDIMYA